jgi:hypothetical protein
VRPQATGQQLSPDQVRMALANAADMTENRMGQMTYDNMFYNRVIKDSLLHGFRAYGWQLGKYRELAGVVGETGQFAADVARLRKPEFTNRMGYAAALVIGSAIIGGIMHRMFTGKNPETAMDYIHPSIGRLDAHGKPIRLSLPTYLKDLESDWHDFPNVQKMGTSLYHKLNPGIAVAVDLFRNRDFYDTEIRGQDDPWFVQAYQGLKYALGSATPFSISGALKMNEENAGAAQLILPFFGFVPAKKALTLTPAEAKASEIMQEMMPQGSRTQAQFEHSKYVAQIVRDLRMNPPKGKEELLAGIRSAQVTDRDAQKIVSWLSMKPMQYQVHRMSAENAMRVWDLASAQERADIRSMVLDKVANSKTLEPETRTHYLRVLLGKSK